MKNHVSIDYSWTYDLYTSYHTSKSQTCLSEGNEVCT